MKLAEMTVTRFADVLASDAPAPGGGSTAALAGALGAALTAMVCELTATKKQFAEVREDVLAVQTKASDLQKAAKVITACGVKTVTGDVLSNM